MTQNVPTREYSGIINATNLVSGVRIPRIAPSSRSWSQFELVRSAGTSRSTTACTCLGLSPVALSLATSQSDGSSHNFPSHLKAFHCSGTSTTCRARQHGHRCDDKMDLPGEDKPWEMATE